MFMELLGKPTISTPIFISGKLAVVFCVLSPFLALAAPGWFLEIPGGLLRISAWLLYGTSMIVTIMASLELGKSLRVGLPGEKTGLKTHGLYSFSRNPIYASFYPWALATAVLAPSPVVWVLSVYSLYVHHRIILGEEIFLARRFGRQWKEYCTKVRRYA